MFSFRTLGKWARPLAAIALACVLLTLLTPLLGLDALDVLTGSMVPAVHPGDLVLLRHVPYSALRKGQIITYSNPNNTTQTITHRIVALKTIHGTPYVVTKGDANKVADPPVPAGRVVGQVYAVIPFVGRAFGALRTPIGLLLVIVIPAMFVIGAELDRLRSLLCAAPPVRPVRAIDGLYRVSLVLVLAISLVFAGSMVLADSSQATLQDNSVAITTGSSTSPTPSPSPSPTTSPCPPVISITNTGPNSSTSISCSSSSTNSSGSSTSVNVNSSSSQSATSGGINVSGNDQSGTGTQGSISNTSTQSTNINITN